MADGSLPAAIRAELRYNTEGLRGRRDVPEGSGARACFGAHWARIIELLANPIGEACPEIRHRQTMWILRARPNGIRIEFFDDEQAFARRLEDTVAEIRDGAQIHAGRLSWM